jgi:hypothetical protein
LTYYANKAQNQQLKMDTKQKIFGNYSYFVYKADLFY